MRRVLLAVTGWLLTAAAAALVGVLAVSLLGSGLTGGQINSLSRKDVDNALAQARSSATTQPAPGATRSGGRDRSSPAQSPSSTPATEPGTTRAPDVTRSLDSPGGSVIARCAGERVYLVSWTPRQGFHSDEAIRGPARTAYVQFESEDRDVYVTVRCRHGVPHAQAATKRDD